MMNGLTLKRIWLGLGTLVAFSLSGGAAAVPCSDATSGIFTDAALTTPGYTACYDQQADDPSGGPFSGDGDTWTVFGMTWDKLQKFDIGEGLTTKVNVGFTVSPEDSPAVSGTWAITSPGDYTDFVIVLKGGTLGGTDATWSGYKLNQGLLSGWWSYGQGKDVSHISVFGKIGTTPPMEVPEPGSLALLGLGLLGFGIARRRRQA